MTDVDAIRWMASEHDLEFVDLEGYGVDPAAGEILPVELARRHHMVAIKRRFGTPVIATADPDDLHAQDSVRASIGRDFISVVASPDQIDSYIERLFGPEPTLEPEPEPEPGPEPEPEPTLEPQPDQVEQVAEVAVPLIDEPQDDGVGRESVDASVATEADAGAYVDLVLDAPDADVPEAESVVVEKPEPIGAGKGKRSKEDRKRRKSEPAPEPEVLDATDWQELSADSPMTGSGAEPDDLPRDEGSVAELGGSDLLEAPLTTFEPEADAPSSVADDLSLEAMYEPAVTADPGVESAALEPATSILPSFGSDWSDPNAPILPIDLDTGVDQLAELALSLQSEERASGGDEAVIAADLVDEAVATYQEQQGDELRLGGDPIEAPDGTAMFPPLAKALVDGDRVPIESMEAVLEEHYQTGQSIARILTAQKLVSEADLMWGMAQELGLEFVDLDTVGVDLSEAGTIPEATARHHNVMVIATDNGTPVVAASNPTDVFAMDDLRTIMGRGFIVVVATRSQISAYIGRAFNSGGDAADMAMEASLGIEGSNTGNGVDDIQAVTEEAPIVRYVNLLILQALNERASDIHIEPTATELRIRYRIDGVLHDVSTAPRSIASAVTTRLKVMADMNIAEHRVPQDGRISLNVGSKGIDLRMATLPTIYGEKIVMRVLDKSSVVLGFADLGFDEELLTTYEGLYTKPYGTILVTGPTGSGKSTTLYTTLTALNSPEKNIITVEDPVELPLKGVNQVQLNLKAGLNFASALRAILRSDPDVVLVGEIRDKETAVIAIEAALTGHMVLATLHTNSAASTPMRLIEMGLEPFLVTSSVSGVLAQRLARRLCMHCKEAFEPSEADIVAAGWKLEEVEALGGVSKVFRAVGCSACSNTGYRGRKALAELLPMSEEIERVIIEGGSVEEIHRVAVAQGMCTLRQSGLRKAIEGETTLEEVLRVVA
jgi:type IV pilus assembly protein PilB